MTISAEEVYLLNNRMGRVANKCQLGTLIQNAESVVAAEIALADGSVLIGNGSGVAVANAVTGDVTISNTGVTAIASGVVVNADVNASAAIAFSKLAALTSANILVGNGSNVATAVAVTGDISIDNAGLTAIASGVIVDADVNASAAIAFSKLAALTSANILVGNGSNVAAAVAVTGDISIDNAGLTAIASGVIVNADVNASAAIDGSKLASFDHLTDGLNKAIKMAVVDYDFAVHGSDPSIDLGTTLPDNSIVINVVQEILTDFNSTSGTSTVKLNLPTDGDLTTAVTADGSNAGLALGLPDFATAGDWVKTTAARAFTFIASVDDITAGKARWYVSYLGSE